MANHQKRRTWDKDEYRELAKLREEGIRERPEPPIPAERRGTLEQRDYKLDFDNIVGKASVISASTSQSRRGGFYCDVCDCVMKDSQTYTDHLNGKKHQRMLGMSMKVKKVTVNDVRARILSAGKANEAKKNYDFDKTVDDRKKKELEERQRRREEAKRRKREGSERSDSDDDGGRRRYDSDEEPERKRPRLDENHSAPKPKEEPIVQEEIDPEMLAMAEVMGMPLSFGGLKKQ